MKFTTRQLVTLAVFGTLWGVVEMGLGSLFHALHLPLTGALLSAIGLAIALIGRLFVPRRGSTLFIGLIAMLLKLFSIGNVVVGPMIGILFEAALAEIVLSAFGRPSRLSLVVAAAAGVLWTLIQPFFTGWLLFGRDLFIVWLDLLDQGSRLLGLDSSAVLWIVLGLVVLHLAAGVLAGWLAWDTGRRLQTRLVGTPSLPG